MAVEFIDYVHELLAPVGTVRSKRMFGGVGIYIDELFCAIIVDDALYFKGDDVSEPEYAAAHCAPFSYAKSGEVFTMRYYRVPETAMDDAEEIRRWARLGLAAALRKASGQKPKQKPKAAARTSKQKKVRQGSY